MTILINLLLLLLLFIVLGWSANFAVKNIKYIAAVLKIHLFTFGILLGLVTSLPELFLGVNATIDQAAVLSVGNLLGGIIVILGLILGVSLIFNRVVVTDGRLKSLIPAVLVIFSPILFGIDGKYALFDGLAMIGLYVGLILYLYRLNRFSNNTHIRIANGNQAAKSMFFIIIGVIGILIASHWIIGITLGLLEHIQVSQLVIGLVVFSIGTNLPEISIAVTSWYKKSPELSLSHLLSSSFTNVLILGGLALIHPIIFDVNLEFWVLALFLGITLVLFTYSYHSGKKMDRSEGRVLLAVYVLFMIISIYLGFLGK